MNILNQNHWNDPTDYERIELVFAQRNKAYGAYFIRTNYNISLLRALALASFIILSLFMIPNINQLFAKESLNLILTDTTIVIIPPPDVPEDKPIIPEQLVEKPSKHLAAEVNTWRVIKDNADLSESDTQTMDDLNKMDLAKVGDTNGSNEGDINLFPDLKGPGGKENDVIEHDDRTVHTYLSEMPEFIGGNDQIPVYLSENTQYPDDAFQAGVNAKVLVGFVIEKDGTVTDIKILSCTEKGYGFERESRRVVENMPRWKPGKQNGRPARVAYTLPFKYRLM